MPLLIVKIKIIILFLGLYFSLALLFLLLFSHEQNKTRQYILSLTVILFILKFKSFMLLLFRE